MHKPHCSNSLLHFTALRSATLTRPAGFWNPWLFNADEPLYADQRLATSNKHTHKSIRTHIMTLTLSSFIFFCQIHISECCKERIAEILEAFDTINPAMPRRNRQRVACWEFPVERGTVWSMNPFVERRPCVFSIVYLPKPGLDFAVSKLSVMETLLLIHLALLLRSDAAPTRIWRLECRAHLSTQRAKVDSSWNPLWPKNPTMKEAVLIVLRGIATTLPVVSLDTLHFFRQPTAIFAKHWRNPTATGYTSAPFG